MNTTELNKEVLKLRLNDFRPLYKVKELEKLTRKYLIEGFYGHHWAFRFQLFFERTMNTKEFQEGFLFGKKVSNKEKLTDIEEGRRDYNPYKFCAARKLSFDCGYMLGLIDETKATVFKMRAKLSKDNKEFLKNPK